MKLYGIERQVLLVALIPILMMAILLESYLIYSRFSDIDAAMLERSQLMVRQLASSSEYPVFSNDKALLRQYVDGTLAQRDVTRVVVLNPAGKVLMGGTRARYDGMLAKVGTSTPVYQDGNILISYEPIIASQIQVDQLDFSEAPISAAKQPLGAVIIEFSKHRLNIQKHEVLLFSLAVTVFILMVSLMVALWVARRVTRPIVEMSLAIRRIGEGNLNTRISPQPRVQELNNFAAGINQMSQQLQQDRNILETRIAERTSALVASEQESRSLLENSPDTIARYDRDFRRIYVNPAFAAMVEGGAETLLGKKPSDLPKAPDFTLYETRISEVFASGQNTQFELKWLGNSGKEHCSHIRLTAEHDIYGTVATVLAVGRDITELNNSRTELVLAANALRRNEELLKESQLIAGLGSYVLDVPSGLWESSEVLNKLFGIDDSFQRTIEGWLALIHPDDRTMMNDFFNNEVLVQGKTFDKIYRIIRHNDQVECWVHGYGKLEHDTQGRPLSMLGTIQDISKQKNIELDLRIAATAFESHEGIIITDAQRTILRVNSAFTTITGYREKEVIGKQVSLLHSNRHDASFYTAMWERINITGLWEGEIWNQRKNGEVFPELLTITVIKDPDGSVSNYVDIFSDITLRKEAEDKIRNMAFYDSLTQLPNRRLFYDRLEHEMAVSKRSGRYAALMVLDLDNFKSLNDTHGHITGDALLIEAAIRLKSCVRDLDTVARFGGDEFVVVLSELDTDKAASINQASLIAEKIRSSLAEPYLLSLTQGGNNDCTITHHCTVSIGIIVFMAAEKTQDDLIRLADIAMYQSKASGRNQLRFYRENT